MTIGKSQTNSGWVQYRSNAANPFGTGTITINGGGILSADAGNTTPSTLGNNIILNGGELATQGVAMTYSGTITLNPSTNSTVGTVNGQSNTILLSGPVSGSGALTVNSASSVTLTNNNTYSGGTTISGGTLVAGAGTLGTGAVNVGANGTLSVSLGPNIGLAGQYFSTVVSGGNPNQGNFNSLLALQQHIGNAYVAGNPNATPVLTAITPVLNLNNGGAGFPAGVGPNQFEGYYSGLMNVTQSGSYTFYLGSDDGTVLWIDGQLVVNDNHYQGFGYPQQQGSITLGAGEHNIVLGYFQGTGGFSFEAGVSGPGITGMVNLGTSGAPRSRPTW